MLMVAFDRPSLSRPLMSDGGSTVPTGPAGDALAEALEPACDVPDVPEHPATARHSDANAARAETTIRRFITTSMVDQ